MRIICNFLSYEEVDEIKRLATEVEDVGWRLKDKRRAYQFVPVVAPPAHLVARALDVLPKWDKEVRAFIDSFFIHYKDGDYTKPHKDQRSGYRLNVLIVEPVSGDLWINGKVVKMFTGDAVVFSPDSEEHAVTPIKGERLIWSVGLAKTPAYKPRLKKG